MNNLQADSILKYYARTLVEEAVENYQKLAAENGLPTSSDDALKVLIVMARLVESESKIIDEVANV